MPNDTSRSDTNPSNARHIDWSKFRNFSGFLAIFFGTAGGAGLSPWAPGTAGTLIALPLAYWSAPWPEAARFTLWAALFFAGTWAAHRFHWLTHKADHQSIVMDEVVGLGITAWSAGQDLKTLAACFVLFRAFDILKPPPVRQLDRWSKNLTQAPSLRGAPLRVSWACGAGVMLDDVLAGFYALGCVALAQHQGWL